MRISCITFDWGDTLVTNRGNPYRAAMHRAVAQLARQLDATGHPPPDGWIAATTAGVCDDWQRSGDESAHPDHREIDALAAFDQHLAAVPGLGRQAARDEALAPMLAELFRTLTDFWMPYPGAVAALHELHAQGYRIGICSHTPWPPEHCRAWFERHELGRVVDFLSLSSAVGWIKPHPAHFLDTIAQAGCPAGAILHVGDHPQRDVCGARDAGLRSCLKRTEGFYSESSLDDCRPDLEILHVKELPARLQELDWSDTP